jgi:hypothetical protein
MRRWLTLISGLIMIAALGLPAGAQAASSAPATADVSHASCNPDWFFLDVYRGGWPGYIGSDNNLHFDSSDHLTSFCQSPISSGSKIVVIYDEDTGNGDNCLALNSTTGAIYLHSATACTSSSPPSYLEWKFIYIKPVGNGFNYYELQNQFDNFNYCLYDNIQSDPAIYGGCSGSDTFEWFEYQD